VFALDVEHAVTHAGDHRPLWVNRMERLDWATLDYAYGNATNVSELIQTIAFGDEGQACGACATLHDELIHQASIFSSTYEAIPFLIETLAMTDGRSVRYASVLNLLDDIISSCVHWIEMGDKVMGGWTLPGECIEHAWRGSDLFARLLQNEENAEVRSRGADLLGMLLAVGPGFAPAGPPDCYASAVAALTARLQGKEADWRVLPGVVFALGRAAMHDRKLIPILREAGTTSDDDEPARIAAALAIVEVDEGKHANLSEVDLLIDTMCRAAAPETLLQVFAETGSERRIRWIVGLRFRLSTCLCAWSAGDPARMERVLPALLASARRTFGLSADVDLAPIFAWLWPDRHTELSDRAEGGLEYVRPPSITPKDLTVIARRVLQACYDNPSIWEPAIGNTSLTFSDVGLPETRAGLKALLDGSIR
jgi:hypothetical protein